MEKTKNKLTSFTDHLDKQYGQKGTTTREVYEQDLLNPTIEQPVHVQIFEDRFENHLIITIDSLS